VDAGLLRLILISDYGTALALFLDYSECKKYMPIDARRCHVNEYVCHG
jgi:hypothetical protein